MIRGVVFDLFDTLVDQDHSLLPPPVEVEGERVSASTQRLHAHLAKNPGFQLKLREFSVLQREVDRSLFRETLKQGFELPTERRFRALAERLAGTDYVPAPEVPNQLTEIHMGLLRETVTIPKHHEGVLAALGVDHGLALCSNFSHSPTARAVLDEAGFTPHLDHVVISEDVGIRKPRPEIFEAVLEQLGCGPREVLHVGDSLRADVEGAAACGLRTVWLTRRIKDPAAQLRDYSGPRPDFALEDLNDLPVLVARLTN